VSALLARVQSTHAYRSWTRYGNARGNLQAGGVTFVGFFSVIPVLILAFSVFGFVLRDHQDLFDRIVSYISQTLPGIVKDAAHPNGLLDASQPPTPNLLTIAGLVSLVTLVLAGLGWVNAIREGTRAMFDQPRQSGNLALRKLRDLGLLALLGVPVLASGVLSLLVSGAASWLLDRAHINSSSTGAQTLVRVLGVLVILVADFILMVIILQVMSGLSLSRRDVGQGALIGAIGMGLLKLASGLLLASASRKPVLASFAVIIGLLLLINLISRVVLLSAAWAATSLDEQGRLEHGVPVPPLPRPAGPREIMQPSFGQRSADRTAVAAGAVLGVSALFVARSVRDGLRAAVGAVRGR
jgi:membrane protein